YVPDRLAEGAGQMGDAGIDSNDEVEHFNGGGCIGKVVEIVRKIVYLFGPAVPVQFSRGIAFLQAEETNAGYVGERFEIGEGARAARVGRMRCAARPGDAHA